MARIRRGYGADTVRMLHGCCTDAARIRCGCGSDAVWLSCCLGLIAFALCRSRRYACTAPYLMALLHNASSHRASQRHGCATTGLRNRATWSFLRSGLLPLHSPRHSTSCTSCRIRRGMDRCGRRWPVVRRAMDRNRRPADCPATSSTHRGERVAADIAGGAGEMPTTVDQADLFRPGSARTADHRIDARSRVRRLSRRLAGTAQTQR